MAYGANLEPQVERVTTLVDTHKTCQATSLPPRRLRRYRPMLSCMLNGKQSVTHYLAFK
jgi:hypothetical protein